VIYLTWRFLIQPIFWAGKLLMWIAKRPPAFVRGIRDHRMRKNVKVAAQAAKRPPS
jgi:hypothetical protein